MPLMNFCLSIIHCHEHGDPLTKTEQQQCHLIQPQSENVRDATLAEAGTAKLRELRKLGRQRKCLPWLLWRPCETRQCGVKLTEEAERLSKLLKGDGTTPVSKIKIETRNDIKAETKAHNTNETSGYRRRREGESAQRLSVGCWIWLKEYFDSLLCKWGKTTKRRAV